MRGSDGHRPIQERRGRSARGHGDFQPGIQGRRFRHGQRREVLQAAGRLRRTAASDRLLHLVERHADHGGCGRPVLHGRHQRPHHAFRARLRPAADRVRLRRLHGRCPGELRHPPAGADLLPVGGQHAVRRTDRRVELPALRLPPRQLPVQRAGIDAGSGQASVPSGSRRRTAHHRPGHPRAAGNRRGRGQPGDGRRAHPGKARARAAPPVQRDGIAPAARQDARPRPGLHGGQADPRRPQTRRRRGAGAIGPGHGVGARGHARTPRRRGLHRWQHAGRELPQRALGGTDRRGRGGGFAAPGHRVPVRERAVRGAGAFAGHQLRRPAGHEHGDHGQQVQRHRDRDGARRPRGAGQPRHPHRRRPGRRVGGGHRLPRAHQGRTRRRRQGNPGRRDGGRLPRGVPPGVGGGAGGVRQRRCLPRTICHLAAPYRGAGAARLPRQHPGSGTARLQRPARQAEGDRGVGVDHAAGAARRRRAPACGGARGRRGLRRRGNGRVHLRPRRGRGLLHGDEHPAAGGASGDRVGLGGGHRPRAAAHRRRREHRRARHRRRRLRHRGAGSTPSGSSSPAPANWDSRRARARSGSAICPPRTASTSSPWRARAASCRPTTTA